MSDKYNSTDFWYTFLNSLYNHEFTSDRGELKIDEEMQEKILTYLTVKIEEGVTDGHTTLPPGLHNYIWRLPKQMLPKLRALAEGFLATDPENAAALMILTIVAGEERAPEYQSHLESLMKLIPKDPGTNLMMIKEFHSNMGSLKGNFDGLETFLTVLENLYEWAKKEGTTVRYQDVKSAYDSIGRSPGTPYTRAKKKLLDLKENTENPENQKERNEQIEACQTRIKRCIKLFHAEQAAFQKESLQELDEQQDLGDPTSEKIDFWETYLNSLDDSELSSRNWNLTPKTQEQLLTYFKTRIEVGVVDGKTVLPTELPKYISRFPRVMRIELREFAEEVLEKQPNNGAAAKILAIIVDKEEFPYLKQAIELLPNDAEMCFFAIKRVYDNDNAFFERTLPALEKLFACAKQQNESELYLWLTKLYKDIGRTPCHIYRKLMQHREANSEQIEKCKPLILQAEKAFLKRLEEDPEDWYASRGLGDIYETLGQTELAKKYPWEPHPEFRWSRKAWEGLEIPNFSATTLDGKPISISDYRDKLVLLNFCAKWCGPCKGEIPYVKQVYEEHHKNGFEVISVSLDDSEAELREHIEAYDIPWLHIFDGKGWKNDLAQYFGINSIPSTWLIDRDGKIISVDARQESLVKKVNWTESARVGDTVPDFSAVDIDENPVSPTTFRGKVVLLYLGFPEQLLTDVEPIYRKYHTKGFEVIGVSMFLHSSEDKFRARVHKENLLGQHVYDCHGCDGPLARQFGTAFWRCRPAIVLIDKEGKIIMSRYEDVHSQAAWIARLEELVATNLGL